VPAALRTLSSFILPSTMAVVVYRLLPRKQRKRLILTCFRRGVQFVGDALSGVLEAGAYTCNPCKQDITVVDTRPHPVWIERLSFQYAVRHGQSA